MKSWLPRRTRRMNASDLPSGDGSRRHRSARPRRDRGFPAGRQIAAKDRKDHAVRILVVFEQRARRHVLREVQILAVGRHRGLAQILLLRFARGDLQTGRSVWVIHPDFARAERARRDEVPARVDRHAVRAPRRAVHEPLTLARDLFQIRAVRLHRPDVPEAVAVARERDPRAVRAEARLHFERRAAQDPRGRPALDRHRVDVTEDVEHNPSPVRADVHIHPRALGRVEGRFDRRTKGRLHVPFRGRRRLCCGRERKRNNGHGRRECGQ